MRIPFESAIASFAVAATIALLPASAAAQSAAPAPAASAAPVAPEALAKHSCGVKPEHPGNLASDTRRRIWIRDANLYLDCLKKFATEQRELAERSLKTANATIDEYNATAKEFQQAAEAAAK